MFGGFAAYIPATLPQDYLNGAAGTEQLVDVDATRGPIRVGRSGSTTTNVFGVTAGVGTAPAGKPLYLCTSGAEGRIDASSILGTGYGGLRGANDAADEFSAAVYGTTVAGSLFTGVGGGIALARSANFISNAVGGVVIGTFTARAVYVGANAIVTYSLDATLAHLLMERRLCEREGASVASAATTTLGADGNQFPISGTTTINTITITNWPAGSKPRLRLTDAVPLAHAVGNLRLAASLNFTGANGDRIGFQSDGTLLWEIWRTVV